MTIRYDRSKSADQHARRGFAEYARAPLPGLSVRGLRLSPGVPLFRAGFEAARDGTVLDDAHLSGWRYFAFDETRSVAGDVTRNERMTFSHLFGGSTVARTLHALSYAERLASDDVAEVRLLTIPSVAVTAVWLLTAQPWLIIVRKGLRKMRPHGFVEHIRRRALSRKIASAQVTER